MIRYTQIITIPQNEPLLQKLKRTLTKDDGWTISETTVDLTLKRTEFFEVDDEIIGEMDEKGRNTD